MEFRELMVDLLLVPVLLSTNTPMKPAEGPRPSCYSPQRVTPTSRCLPPTPTKWSVFKEQDSCCAPILHRGREEVHHSRSFQVALHDTDNQLYASRPSFPPATLSVRRTLEASWLVAQSLGQTALFFLILSSLSFGFLPIYENTLSHFFF